MRIVSRVALFCLLVVIGGVVLAVELPPPPDAQVQSIAASTSAMGMRLSIRRFTSRDPVEQVLAFYRDRWKEKANEVQMTPWQMIGTLEEDRYLNVQVQADADGGSWGYLSIGDLPQRVKDKRYSLKLDKTAFPMMSGSTLINDQIDDDVAKDGRTLLISNRFSPQANYNYYRNHYRGQNWEELMGRSLGKGRYALYFQRGRESVALTIAKEGGGSMVVANKVKRGLLR